MRANYRMQRLFVGAALVLILSATPVAVIAALRETRIR